MTMRVATRLRMLLVLCGVIGACCAPARAGLPETPQPQQLTVADGLPSNRINDIAEDRFGYLWIATSDGLARYDGIGFRVWRVGHGLRDNQVWAVHVDAANRVWIGTAHAGLALLDVQRNAFRYYNRTSSTAIGSDEVWSIASTPDGMLWFGTADGGLHRLAPGGAITHFMPSAGNARSLPDASVGQLAVAPDGALWVGTKNGVARWTGHDFERLPATALNSPAVNGLTIDPDGTLWVGTPRGVSVRRPDGSLILSPWSAYGKMLFHVLLRDRSGSYWFDTVDGLGRDSDGVIRDVPLYSDTSHGGVKPSWSRAYQDREGGLWFASSDSGLWYLRANWHRFSVLSREAGDPGSMGNAYVHGIAPSASGDMWLVGSGGVLDRLDPETGNVAHMLADAGAGYMPMDVLEDHAGKVWISYYKGLATYDPGSGALQRWASQDARDPALPAERARFAELSDGRVWIASEREGMQWRDGQGVVLETVMPGDGHGLPAGSRVLQIGSGPDGAPWIAGTMGLCAWNSGAHRFEPIAGAPRSDVHAFARGSNGVVWIARFGAIERYRWNGAELARTGRYDERQGLPALAPNGMTVDSAGVVWMTSVRGLMRFDPASGSTRLYGVRDGLPSQEFGEQPVPRAQDGRIAAATPEGLVVFDPAAVHPSRDAPALVIESASVRRGDHRIDFAASGVTQLANDDRDVRIVARLLSFDNAGSNHYRFLLTPYDPDWIESGASGERDFSQLPPGAYTLKVMARTADNVWSDMRTLRFDVAPPWWRTPWALVAFAVTLALAVWWMTDVYRARLRRRNAWQLLLHKREVAEQASLAKTRFLATLGHEVRTPMTGVLGMSELLLGTPLDGRQRGYAEAIRRAGEHLLRLMNDALDLARIESGKLQLDRQPFDLRALLGDLVQLMQPLAEHKRLRFEADIASDLPAWVDGDGTRIRQILLNLLGNAVKFTADGNVCLRAYAAAADDIAFEVADTGPGLSIEQQSRLFQRFEQAEGARTAARYGGSGLGLAISQELAAAMGGRIDVESIPGQGTRFRVVLPLAGATQPAGAEPVPVAGNTGRSLRLLLVEDDAIVADVLSALLRAQGHDVVHAGHGLGAMAETTRGRFDAALLDLDLPGLDGLSLARLLRAQGFSAPLLAVTARADSDVEALARAAGFDGFLRKPVTGTMLAESIHALVGPGLQSEPA